jgi:hypothetical protein
MVELQTAIIEIMVIEEGEKPFAMLQDLWLNHPDRSGLKVKQVEPPFILAIFGMIHRAGRPIHRSRFPHAHDRGAPCSSSVSR